MGRRKGDKTIVPPPIHTRFQKGHKNSPDIKKKISESVKKHHLEKKSILTHTRELLQLDIIALENRIKDIQSGKKDGITVAQYIAMKAVQGGMKGDPRFIKDITDREYGTPKQSVELSGETTTNMNVNVIQQIQQTLENSKKDGEMDREG